MYNINENMKKIDAYENENFIENLSQIWKRENYQHKFCNKIVNHDYTKQYCLIGEDTLELSELRELYNDKANSFIILSNTLEIERLQELLDSKGYGDMRCYSLLDCNREELERYFMLLCKCCDNYEIIYPTNKNSILNIDISNFNKLHRDYINNTPTNHIIIDNAINKDLITSIKNDILKIPIDLFEKANVYGVDNKFSINKFFLKDINSYQNIKLLKDYLSSKEFLLWLENITNIKNLKIDNDNIGAGIHLIKRGGYLNLHYDSSIHINSKKFRRVNILLYLNEFYNDNHNGKLELWNKSLKFCEKTIAPIFNRMIIFNTIDSIHGHPIPWNSDNDRISLALYYYTDELEIDIEKHKNNTSALWLKPLINVNNYPERHIIINNYIIKKNKKSYLEIGIETGYTFTNVNIEEKIGVDPDPKIESSNIIKKTSDEFFKNNDKNFDIIFIDGMHQLEYVLKDFNNSVKFLNKNGIIFIDDVLPISKNEQEKIPINPIYENGILKYSSPWTGDVWKFIYYLLLNFKDKIEYTIFSHQNYRGVIKICLKENFTILESSLLTINSYDYDMDFEDYKKILFS
jgi:Rps23 Pro-64 3,4-dihydroxylase Tpa1-like proline 4-hydroxylase